MNLLRPRYTAAATGAYFAIVLYLAWDTARQTTGAWYDAPMSETVYQTSLVAGILVVAGLLVVASMHPRVALAAPSLRRRARRNALQDPGAVPSELSKAPNEPTSGESNAGWELLEHFVQDLTRPADAPSLRARLSEDGDADAPSTRTGAERRLPSPSLVSIESEEYTSARPLPEYATEIQALIVAARRVGVTGPQAWRLAGEPAVPPGNDPGERGRLAEHVRATLETAVNYVVRDRLEDALVQVQAVNAAAKRAHGAELLLAEAGTFLDVGNFLAAYDRLESAAKLLRSPIATERPETHDVGTSSWVVLTGPVLIAIAYVAASSMLLPGVGGFLQNHYVFNTTIVLVLSYGWLGLLIYTLVSVYLTLRAGSPADRRRAAARE